MWGRPYCALRIFRPHGPLDYRQKRGAGQSLCLAVCGRAACSSDLMQNVGRLHEIYAFSGKALEAHKKSWPFVRSTVRLDAARFGAGRGSMGL